MTTCERGVWQACLQAGEALSGKVLDPDGQPIDGPLLLWTISGLESSHGVFREFVRFESAYAPGGRYAHALSWKRWGVLAASSFGSFQIMYPVARELGFTGHPIDLQDDKVCAHWASILLLSRLITRQKATKLSDVLDAYNSGTHRDMNVPTTYVRNGILLYRKGRPEEGV